jgi:uncharacterized protein YegL
MGEQTQPNAQKPTSNMLSTSGAETTLALSYVFSTPLIRPTADRQLLYLLVQVTPAQEKMIANVPLNLCLVLDRSSSMRGEKMERVKEAARYVVDQLGPADTFSVVTFNDRANVVVRAQRVISRDNIKNLVDAIEARGGTEMASGMATGLDEINSAYSPTAINYMLLLTDGQTYGDEEQCATIAKQCAERKIVISPLGIGDEWNEDLLETIAARTGSSSDYIDSAAKIVAAFRSKVDGFRSVFARNAALNFYLEHGSEVQRIHRVSPTIVELAYTAPESVAQRLAESNIDYKEMTAGNEGAESAALSASEPDQPTRGIRSLLGSRMAAVSGSSKGQSNAPAASPTSGGSLRDLFNRPLPPARPKPVEELAEGERGNVLIGESEARAGLQQRQEKQRQSEQQQEHERHALVLRLSPSRDAQLVTAPLGQLRSDEEQVFLIELIVSPQAPGTRRIGRLVVVFDPPGQQDDTQAVANDLLLGFSLEVRQPYAQNTVVKSVVEKVIAFKLQHHAWLDLKAGDVSQATMRLKMVATHLLSAGETELAGAVNAEIAHLESFGQVSRSGTKKIKYGTRGLASDAATSKLFKSARLNTTSIAQN